MTPREIVSELDRYIVGQKEAKRAVAIALRNRWRRQLVPEDLRDEIAPKNIIMIGPTGVGKTEISRRLAKLAQAPFIKWLGRIGYAARGVIFLTVAWLIGKAALDGRSQEAGGMEQALDFFSGPILYTVALGLLLFGAFSIVEALFRRIHEPPPPAQMEQKVREKLAP